MAYRVTILLALLLTGYLSAIAQQSSPVAGDWNGTLNAGSQQLPLVFHIQSTPAGLASTMDSPAQGASGIPVTTTTLAADGTLTLEIASIHGGFTGKLAADSTTLTGEWKQGSASLPLTLKRGPGPKPATQKRPQTPVAPFPYRSEELHIRSAAPGVMLAATLTEPEGRGPFPAVLLIAGSGPHDRDETIMGHKPFLVLADYLTRHGIAVLRADKRGFASSTGDYASATTADFATDSASLAGFLRSRPEIDHSRIGLIGHSEGGLIAPIVAAPPLARIDFVVLMAGPGVPGLDLLVEQTRLLNLAGGATPEAAQHSADFEREFLNLIVNSKDNAALLAQLHDKLAATGVPAKSIDAQIKPATSPWFRYFLTYDPAPTLAKVRCPVLALDGTKDIQVSATQNLPAIKAALEAGGNHHVEIVTLPGLNHLFQPAETGTINEYATIEQTISPAVLEKITSWILAQPPLPSQPQVQAELKP